MVFELKFKDDINKRHQQQILVCVHFTRKTIFKICVCGGNLVPALSNLNKTSGVSFNACFLR